MTDLLERALLAGTGLAFVVIGLGALLWPETIASVTTLTPGGVAAFSELRSSYGGIHLVVGLFLLVATMRANLRAAGLWFIVGISGGYVVGRTVSFVLDGAPPSWVFGAYVVELLGVVMGVALLARRGRRERT